MFGNKEREDLNKFEGKDKKDVIEYIPLLFIAPPQKESNCLIDIGKKIRSLNHLI